MTTIIITLLKILTKLKSLFRTSYKKQDVIDPLPSRQPFARLPIKYNHDRIKKIICTYFDELFKHLSENKIKESLRAGRAELSKFIGHSEPNYNFNGTVRVYAYRYMPANYYKNYHLISEYYNERLLFTGEPISILDVCSGTGSASIAFLEYAILCFFASAAMQKNKSLEKNLGFHANIDYIEKSLVMCKAYDYFLKEYLNLADAQANVKFNKKHGDVFTYDECEKKYDVILISYAASYGIGINRWVDKLHEIISSNLADNGVAFLNGPYTPDKRDILDEIYHRFNNDESYNVIKDVIKSGGDKNKIYSFDEIENYLKRFGEPFIVKKDISNFGVVIKKHQAPNLRIGFRDLVSRLFSRSILWRRR